MVTFLHTPRHEPFVEEHPTLSPYELYDGVVQTTLPEYSPQHFKQLKGTVIVKSY